MPRPCTVCTSPDRSRIEQSLAAGFPIARIAADRGLSRRSIQRHIERHLRPGAKDAAKRHAAKAGESVLERVQRRGAQADEIVTEARSKGALDAANGAIGQGLRADELAGRITGEVPTGGGVTVINQLGVRIDEAKRAVEVMQDAQSVAPREVVERALRVCRAWNAANPGERVEV
jgi:hypothetical protein